MKLILIILIFFTGLINAKAETPTGVAEKKPIISGNIKDAKTGEQLIGATVYIKELKTGTVTNVYGFYSLSIAPGSYTLVYSYIGYESVEKKYC